MNNPYSNLPPSRYWRTAVAEAHPLRIPDLYRKKFPISLTDRIATAGSCFAQHIARHLKSSGYSVIDREPAPNGTSDALAAKYGFGLYSARYGNVYTSRQLLQLAREAFNQFTPQDIAWEKDGRFYDALRPSVEPSGLDSEEEVYVHRRHHLKHVAAMLADADLLIFTLGLTETWENVGSGTVYPSAPGTIAGKFNPATTRFKNLSYGEVLDDFLSFRELVKSRNQNIRFLLTVSPVPLTATASSEHVLPATIYSKSILRAVAGHLYHEFDDVDYFPSYEIISSHPARGIFYENNMRNVAPEGVNVVMNTFFSVHKRATPPGANLKKTIRQEVCEEALLEAFSK